MGKTRTNLDFGFYNMDCMEGMRQFPDKFFDLAIVDPPYGINVGQASMGAGGELLHTLTGQRGCAPGGATDRISRSEENEIPNSCRRSKAVWQESIRVGG